MVMSGMTASYIAGMLDMTAGYIVAGGMTPRYLTVMFDVAAKYLAVVLVMTARYVTVMSGPLTHPPPSPQACPGAASIMEVAPLSPCNYLSCFCPSLPSRPHLALWCLAAKRKQTAPQVTTRYLAVILEEAARYLVVLCRSPLFPSPCPPAFGQTQIDIWDMAARYLAVTFEAAARYLAATSYSPLETRDIPPPPTPHHAYVGRGLKQRGDCRSENRRQPKLQSVPTCP